MDRWLQSLVAAGITIALLYFARSILVPLATAVLLAVVLAPTVKRLEHLGAGRIALGRISSVLIVAVMVAVAFLGVGWLLATQGSEVVERLPEYRRVVVGKLRDLRQPLASLERAAREVREAAVPTNQPAPTKVEVVDGRSELVGLLSAWVGSVASLLGAAGLVIVLLVFLLIEREDLRNRLIRIAGPANMRRATSTFGDATQRLTRYLRALVLLNIGHGAVVGIGLWMLGLPSALLFGLLSALLRFVPYIGPWVAASVPIALSVAVSETWTMPLVVASFFALIELVSNNAIEPLLFGASVGLSPFGIILSAIFWAWLWGPVGLVLATPLTVCLVVLGRHVPRLAGLSMLLSNVEPLRPAQRLYQRLLARDIDEATDLVSEHAQEFGVLSAWDEVVLPALSLLDRDQQGRLLEADELECARETVEVLLAELPEPKTDGPLQQLRAIQCLPARSWGDELACLTLAHFLRSSGIPGEAAGRRMVSELVELAARSEAPAVCIWSLDSLDSGALRHLVMRVRNRCPGIAIVVGVCGEDAWRSSVQERLGPDPRIHVVRTLAAAQERLMGLIDR